MNQIFNCIISTVSFCTFIHKLLMFCSLFWIAFTFSSWNNSTHFKLELLVKTKQDFSCEDRNFLIGGYRWKAQYYMCLAFWWQSLKIYQHEQLFESSATFRFSLHKQNDYKTIKNKLVKIMFQLLNDDMINMSLTSDITSMPRKTLSQKIET